MLKMKEDEIISNNTVKKPSRKRYVFAAVLAVLLISALVYVGFNQEPKPDPASERIIRKVVAAQLNKDPNDLTNEDFAKITAFNINGTSINNQEQFMYIPPWVRTELTDIRLLKKFTNLELLDLISVKYPEKNIPKWMKYLAKHGVFDLEKEFAIDLSPIKNLSALKKLRLYNAQINDITPLNNLTNLEELYITNCQNITDEQVGDLQKALPNLRIIR
jgi:Leucine-rich repeat (LRR) protein